MWFGREFQTLDLKHVNFYYQKLLGYVQVSLNYICIVPFITVKIIYCLKISTHEICSQFTFIELLSALSNRS